MSTSRGVVALPLVSWIRSNELVIPLFQSITMVSKSELPCLFQWMPYSKPLLVFYKCRSNWAVWNGLATSGQAGGLERELARA